MEGANLYFSFTVFVIDGSYWNFFHCIFHLYISLRDAGVSIDGQFDMCLASLNRNSVKEKREHIFLMAINHCTHLLSYLISMPVFSLKIQLIDSSLMNPQGDL